MTGTTLYLAHGEYVKPDTTPMRSFYCGLPVRATSENEAREIIERETGGTVNGVKPTGRMPILDLADEWTLALVKRLTA